MRHLTALTNRQVKEQAEQMDVQALFDRLALRGKIITRMRNLYLKHDGPRSARAVEIVIQYLLLKRLIYPKH